MFYDRPKELKSLFASPLAWMVLTAVQLIAASRFLKRLDDFLQIQPQLVQPRARRRDRARGRAALRDRGAHAALRRAAARHALDRGGAAQPDDGVPHVRAAFDDADRARQIPRALAFLALIVALVTAMPLSLARAPARLRADREPVLRSAAHCRGFRGGEPLHLVAHHPPVAAAFGSFAACSS